jgi:hypothetical protein
MTMLLNQVIETITLPPEQERGQSQISQIGGDEWSVICFGYLALGKERSQVEHAL